ncbi:fumarylacetoacetate hydrolase family protein [Stenotrophomonas maltophilia]|uniref:fumarylacetoacetate hydrolase family protein n=1 Tax=Stenotrophomonas maltophilia TaxID=40324 RepID=UPI001D0CB572|nr:fumarylacetoacetate hydrolase family protein [Stenotrophomonas maltophilia]UXF72578.1 fumarylacetoacetate hydrolase family protein [Stenotrophomonas maltophilia]
MKLLTYLEPEGSQRVGALGDGGYVVPLSWRCGRPVRCMIDLIKGRLSDAHRIDDALDGSTLRWLAPIPRPERNLFCVGKNYAEHAREFSLSGFDSSSSTHGIPEHPIVFSKTPQTVIGPGATIWDAAGVSDALDYEAELAVVIGKPGRAISPENAMEHVWGYTALNDVTARDWQKRHQQWHLGKSFDTFAPMGPVIVTADELHWRGLELRCWVNGDLRQRATTADLIFDVPTLIATISQGITLQPGDIIATGTPEGVGLGFTPPRYLKRGDRIAIEIAGIGKLENEVGPWPEPL